MKSKRSIVKRKIIEILQETDAVMATEIAKELKISKPTAYKYLTELAHEGKVEYKEARGYKIWFLGPIELEAYEVDGERRLIDEAIQELKEKGVVRKKTDHEMKSKLQELRAKGII